MFTCVRTSLLNDYISVNSSIDMIWKFHSCKTPYIESKLMQQALIEMATDSKSSLLNTINHLLKIFVDSCRIYNDH